MLQSQRKMASTVINKTIIYFYLFIISLNLSLSLYYLFQFLIFINVYKIAWIVVQLRIQIRNKPAVFCHRYYTLNSDRGGYFHNLITCHMSCRNDSRLMPENKFVEQCFLRRKHELKSILKSAVSKRSESSRRQFNNCRAITEHT